MATVLILDDERSIRVTLAAFVESAGHETLPAASLAEAKQLVEAEAIDVAIIDLVLPDGSGVEVARALRRHQPKTQLIFLTGEPDIASARDAILLKATDYLTKPVRQAKILAVVEDAVHEKQRRDEYERLRAEEREHRRNLQQEVEVRTRELLEARKMEALGQLCAGVSHEYNNILMGIVGYAHHLQKQLPDDSTGYQYAQKIRLLSDQAGRVSRQLLSFSRPEPRRHFVTALDDLVAESVSMFSHLAGEDIVTTTDLASHASVCVDKGQIQEVLLNLVLNARDAMPHGGTLRITTRSRGQLGPDTHRALELDDGRGYACVAVTDEGEGMAEETLERAFDPFFTTKPHGKGTGLGLSSAHGLVKANGGGMQLHSRPGTGTTVEVFLPTAIASDPPGNDSHPER